MEIYYRSYLLVFHFLWTVIVIKAHSRWSCPPARNPSTAIKRGPCGPETDIFSGYGIPVPISPGPMTVTWEESIAHRGAPWRISLSRNGSDTEESCLLLDHIPHNDLSRPKRRDESTWTKYSMTIEIPDVSCEYCSLHFANPMTDKIGSLGSPEDDGCTDPDGTCFSVYHSCTVPLNITGSIPRDEYECPNRNPLDWPIVWKGDDERDVDASTLYVYRREHATWDSEWLMDAPERYRELAGSMCTDLTGDPTVAPIMITDDPTAAPITRTNNPTVAPIMITDDPSAAPITRTNNPTVLPIIITEDPSAAVIVNDDANPKNHEACPTEEPVFGVSSNRVPCDNTQLTSNINCEYNPYVCPGFGEGEKKTVLYTSHCICLDEGFFECSQAMIVCADDDETNNNDDDDRNDDDDDSVTPTILTCPNTKPHDGSSCSIDIMETKCRYTPTNCPDSTEINFEDTCICVGGIFSCIKTEVECHNAVTPQCPILNPDGQSQECNIDDESFSCNYNPSGCPETMDPGVFLTKCQCQNGVFVCTNSPPIEDCSSYNTDTTTITTDSFSGITACFPGSAVVDVEGRGSVAMEDLQVGDMVRVGVEEYEPIYSFGHKAMTLKGDYLELHTANNTSPPLYISGYHMIYEKNRGFVSASSISIADELLLLAQNNNSYGDDSFVKVTRIRVVTSLKGMYAPFTPSGKIIVNDIMTSSYVDFLDSQKLFIPLQLLSSPQWIAHAGEFPHRLACHYSYRNCKEELYDNNGVNYFWGTIPLRFFESFVPLQSNIIMTWIFSLFFGFLLVSFWMMEQMLILCGDTLSSSFALVGMSTAIIMMFQMHNIKQNE